MVSAHLIIGNLQVCFRIPSDYKALIAEYSGLSEKITRNDKENPSANDAGGMNFSALILMNGTALIHKLSPVLYAADFTFKR
jgi:hypothetical protein